MKNKISLTKIICTIAFVILLVFSLYLFITKSHRNIYWCTGSITFHIISFTSLIILWSKKSEYPYIKKKTAKQNIMDFTLILIGVFYFIFLFIVSGKYEDNQLMKYGEYRKAKVISSFERYIRKGGGMKRFVKIEYTFNNKSYHQEFRDAETIYRIGDEVIILISKKDPLLFEVLNQP